MLAHYKSLKIAAQISRMVLQWGYSPLVVSVIMMQIPRKSYYILLIDYIHVSLQCSTFTSIHYVVNILTCLLSVQD